MPNPQEIVPRTFAMLLFDGFSNLCLANAVEPLRAANTLAGATLYRWHYLSLDGAVVHSSSDLPVQTARLHDFAGGHCLCVMPSYHHRAHATPACATALRAAAARFDCLAGLDTGSWLLAAAGLLDGRRATSHWDILTSLAEAFPEVQVSTARQVIDGDRLTCGGATTTLDLMLDVIGRQHGTALALNVAAMFMVGDARDQAAPPLPANRLLRAAATIMRRHLENPLPIAAIAAELRVSQRTLEAAARSTGSPPPRALYRTIRLEEARRWVTTSTISIAEVATRCGYQDAAAMTRAFVAAYGLPPRAMRRKLVAN
jgi:transcriptional regulator GlxA family with amidase domain